MSTSIDTDLLVFGDGFTGLAAASAPADQGLRMMLVERHAEIGDEPRAISITDGSLRVLLQIRSSRASRP